jgi:hypothetical protein
VSSSSRLIAASIFGGCVVIALALYLALRPRAGSAPAPRAVPRVPVTIDSEALKARVSEDVQAVLRARMPRWIETCWNPAVAANPTPATSKHTINITFDAEGNEIARGISDVRDEPSRDDVGACLRADREPIRVPPPKQTIQVVVWLRLPS